MSHAFRIELRTCRTCGLLKRLVSASRKRNRIPGASYSAAVAQKKRNHYETLGIAQDATSGEIKDAFLKLSKQLHPDTNPNKDTHDMFVELHQAYKTLSKTSSKREYDFSLASAFHYQQEMMRHGYSQHTPGGSARPGMGAAPGNKEGDERVFWDETIWSMRDKSKDDQYMNQPYYGVKGVKHISNGQILMGCIGLIALGSLIHYAAYRYTSTTAQAILDHRDRVASAHLMASRAAAKKYGNAAQLETLKAKLGASGNGKSKADSK